MKAIFLYMELADYSMMCFKRHLELYPEDEIHVIHYPINEEAPFAFEQVHNLFLYRKDQTDTADMWEIFDRIKPDVVLCSGWNDAFYNKFVKAVKKLVPVVLCFDNIFRYTLKQMVGLPVARMLFKGVYSGVWVPGEKQKEFARLLGFKNTKIFTGFYSTDNQNFNKMYLTSQSVKAANFPKRMLCVARYIPQKGLEMLWKTFAELCEEENAGWELWCAGTGEDFSSRMIHPSIQHLGFVQPKEFDKLVEQCGVFVLPSLFEPWGVVVNEFAAAGMPLLLSDKVGSASTYLKDGINGWSFEAGNKSSLKQKLKEAMNTSTEKLLEMGEWSNKLGLENSAERWSETLIQLSKLGKQ
jgi:glycosyltransferase involved in cell wall biosynthesis